MVKRKMKGNELTFAMKGLENKKQEKEWLEYQLAYNELMLKTGLEMNYKKNVRDFNQQKHEYEGELVVVKNVINILTDQIRNGVEVKDKKGNEIKQEDK